MAHPGGDIKLESLVGIYIIEHLNYNKVYIGQSKNLKRRLNQHICRLTNGKHANKYLQRSWNKYGKESFKIYILEYCDNSELNEKEVSYIKKFNSYKKGFNLNEGGSAGNISIESIEKIRKALTGRKLSEKHRNNIRLVRVGKKHTKITKDKVSGILKGNKRGIKISDNNRKKIKELYFNKELRIKDIAKMFNINRHSVSRIAKENL